MSVVCQCPSCKAKYQLGDQYAGRKIKCPKCSAVVEVPAAQEVKPVADVVPAPAAPRKPAAAVSTATVKPIEPSASDAFGEEEMAVATGGDDTLSFLQDKAATQKQAAAHRTAAHDTPAIAGDAHVRPPAAGHAPHVKKKKKSMAGWTIAAIVGSLAVVAIVGGGIYVATHKTEDATAAAGSNKSGKPEIDPKIPQLTFTFKWPQSERSGATLTINGDLQPVPATGDDIKIKLPKIAQPYHFVLERKGYTKKEFARPLTEDDDYTVTQWESESRGIDWEQDFTAAKKAAADQHKNVFIVFDASDAKASAFHSSRLHDSVLASSEFTERAKNEYVCVYIDNPVKDEAKQKVHDAAQNHKVTGDFEITVFPTVVVTDPRGRPFGVLEDYTINGITAFLPLMDKWKHDNTVLFELLEKSKDSSDSETIAKTLDFLELNKLDRFYGKTAKALAEKLPNGGAREVTEQDAEMWGMTFRQAMINPDNVKKDVAAFDRWKEKHTFTKHPDVGAALHAFAALVLAQVGEKEAAKKKCDEALAFKPKDPHIRNMLAMVQEAVTGKPGEHVPLPRGSGSGFCIAQGNYIMTNHHVIRDAKKIMVHLDGQEEKYLAHLVADNPDGDMAVLKIDMPAGKSLTPIPFAAIDVTKGDEVCALGWPGMLSDNLSSTLTNGLISTVHDKEGYLVTNCKIEHGNSGGPLCSVSGCCIAGMVTAKTVTSEGLSESYGLAIPASKLKQFLKEKLPPDVLHKIPRPTNTTGGKLSELMKGVQASVVYVENYQ
jgi:S1-C subfamily serine protease